MGENTCQYTQLSQVDHVLARPSMYIGSVHNKQQAEYVVEDVSVAFETLKIVNKDILTNEALIKIYSEILSNVSDNWQRSAKTSHRVSRVEIDVDVETGHTSVANDGLCIRFDVDKQTGMRVPEMIFGHLLTSSNYAEQEARTGAGVYGIGAKATNIFSKCFSVTIQNQAQKQVYSQKWTENMKTCHAATIQPCSCEGNWVIVSWSPDFKRFDLTGYSLDHIKLMYKMAVDLAMVTGVPVFFNRVKLEIPNFEKYVGLYTPSQEHSQILAIQDKASKTSVALTPGQEFEAVTFVNGLLLKQGVHVKVWVEALLKPVLESLNNSASKTTPSKLLLTLKEVQGKFRIFIKQEVTNPEFANASKTSLIGPIPKVPSVPKASVKEILAWPVVSELKQLLVFKASAGLRKLEKEVKHIHIEGYEAANFARTKKSQECSLLICEGLSAKTFCVKGLDTALCMGKSGRDYFGILPQKGKGLNVLNAPAKQIQENQEIKNLIQALGLKQNVDYTKPENRKTLHYGKVILMTDSDCDGSHISGLIITFFNTMYPSLIQAQDFVYKMATPIITIKKSPQCTYKFYNLFEARRYIQAHSPPAKAISYLKGLGSSSDQLIKEIFGKRMNRFTVDAQTQDLLVKAFHKDFPDVRKEWLQSYRSQDQQQDEVASRTAPVDPESNQYTTEDACISDFIKKDLVEFSIVDCKRSIPSVFDGLKESQRKIVFTCFQKNLGYSSSGLKTSQLAGAVAELTNFKYGEVSLHDTIYRLAQNFVGANNVNLLDPSLSQFGNRQDNGNDHPAARYTKTRLSRLAAFVFRKEDNPLLSYVDDEGQQVEPEHYVPVIPMILVNGCNGIGVGFSSSIPNFSPLQLVDLIRSKLRQKQILCSSLVPWYRGYQGKITALLDTKFEIVGAISDLGDDKYRVTEIPVGKSMKKFKEEVQALVESGAIKKVLNHCTADKVDMTLVGYKGGFKPTLKNLKLVESLHISNMVLFGKQDVLSKYSLDDIFNVYFTERLELYVNRLALQRRLIKEEIELVEQRSRFIEAVINQAIVVYRASKQNIVEQLVTASFEDLKKNGFANLLSIPVVAFTSDELAKLAQQLGELKQKLAAHSRLQASDVWLMELDEFVSEFHKEFGQTI